MCVNICQGESGVGKSCLAIRYTVFVLIISSVFTYNDQKGEYSDTLSTIGAEFFWKTVYEQNKSVKIQLWV